MPNPVALNIPGAEADEFVIARDQPEYIALPALPVETPDGPGVLTRWSFSAEEREQIANGADVWVTHLTFGGPLQPLRLDLDCPVQAPVEPS